MKIFLENPLLNSSEIKTHEGRKIVRDKGRVAFNFYEFIFECLSVQSITIVLSKTIVRYYCID